MESSDVQHATETALAMALLGVKGIRRKLRVKLLRKIYLGSDRGRNTKVRRRGSSINICRKDLKDPRKISFQSLI
jgi:hypothetical protein